MWEYDIRVRDGNNRQITHFYDIAFILAYFIGARSILLMINHADLKCCMDIYVGLEWKRENDLLVWILSGTVNVKLSAKNTDVEENNERI